MENYQISELPLIFKEMNSIKEKLLCKVIFS